VLQTGELPLDNRAGRATTFTLALGFAASATDAERTARASLKLPFAAQAATYMGGWHDYLDALKPAPSRLSGSLRTQYFVIYPRP